MQWENKSLTQNLVDPNFSPFNFFTDSKGTFITHLYLQRSIHPVILMIYEIPHPPQPPPHTSEFAQRKAISYYMDWLLQQSRYNPYIKSHVNVGYFLCFVNYILNIDYNP